MTNLTHELRSDLFWAGRDAVLEPEPLTLNVRNTLYIPIARQSLELLRSGLGFEGVQRRR